VIDGDRKLKTHVSSIELQKRTRISFFFRFGGRGAGSGATKKDGRRRKTITTAYSKKTPHYALI
jgi:hypothetical protein